MTIDFPDWSRTVNQGGQELGGFFGHKGNDPTTGIMDCLGFAYITIEIGDAGNVHYFSIVVTWYSDQAGTNIVGTSVFVPVPGSIQPFQIPLVSRWARVTCSHQVFGDTENVGCKTFGSNVVTNGVDASLSGGPLIVNSGSVPGPGSVFINAQYVHQGAATLYVYTNSANACVVGLEYYDIGTASFRELYNDYLGAVTSSEIFNVSLPPAPVRIGCYNNDSAAHTFTGILVAS